MAYCKLHSCYGTEICVKTNENFTIKVYKCNDNGHYFFEKFEKIKKENLPKEAQEMDIEVLTTVTYV